MYRDAGRDANFLGNSYLDKSPSHTLDGGRGWFQLHTENRTILINLNARLLIVGVARESDETACLFAASRNNL